MPTAGMTVLVDESMFLMALKSPSLAGGIDEVKVMLPASPNALCRQVEPCRWPFPRSTITTSGRANRVGSIAIALCLMTRAAGAATRAARTSIRSMSQELIPSPSSGRLKRVECRIVDYDVVTRASTLPTIATVSSKRGDGSDGPKRLTRFFKRGDGRIRATMLLPLHSL
jgi:hypothetical protein